MFAFTKEQKQDKLARTNVDNYNKLEFSLSTVTDSLQREAILNAMADIVDIFTMLRSTYDLSKPVKTTEDYRLLRVHGMPGIVLDYRWFNSSISFKTHFYRAELATKNSESLQPYLGKALLNSNIIKMEKKYKRKADTYGIIVPFSENSYDTLLSLESLILLSKAPRVVRNNYDRGICQQFAHTANRDILISI